MIQKRIIIAVVLLVIVTTGWGVSQWLLKEDSQSIRIGVLHSLTGTMAISEVSVKDAVLLAVEEINAEGGLLGLKIEPVVADGRSDWPTFAREAERLITQEQVSVIFGGWTSASRKELKPVIEGHNQLLFYPVQYEGLEQSPNIVYTGAAPNQQLIPAVNWAAEQNWQRYFLIGSDYVFPRAANEIIKNQIANVGGELVGEEYLLLGAMDMAEVVSKIVAAKPDVILNTINGSSNVALFEQLLQAGITANVIPVISFSLAEDELRTMDSKAIIGSYASWNYFQSLDSPENRAFVASFKARYGASRVTDDPIEAAYFGVYLWAQAVRECKAHKPELVRQCIGGQSMVAPGGLVEIDKETQHTWKSVRIGQVMEDGQFKVVWDSGQSVRPVPYPGYRTKAQWHMFLNELYYGWDQHWSKQE